MGITLNEIASVIDSNVRTGLKGVSNYAFPIDMLEREVIIERNRLIGNGMRKQGFEKAPFLQDIHCLKLDKEKLSRCPSTVSATDDPIFHFDLPRMDTTMLDDVIEYIGPTSRANLGWKVYFDETYKLHKYKPATCDRPYIYISPTSNGEGMMDAFVFNFSGNLTYLSFTGIIENPLDVELYACHGPLEAFPAPESVVEEIIRRVTAKYLQHYRQLDAPIQPNTQTDQAS